MGIYKNILIVAVLVVIIVAYLEFIAGRAQQTPQPGATTIPNALSNQTKNITQYIASQPSLNATYTGYQQLTYNTTGWYHAHSNFTQNITFVFQYQKFGNYTRINFHTSSQPNSSYFYQPSGVILCSGPGVFLQSANGIKCTSINISQADIFGFIDIGNFSFTKQPLQKLQVVKTSHHQGSVGGTSCQVTVISFQNSTYNGTSTACIPSTNGIPLDYNVTYYISSGSAQNVSHGLVRETIHTYGRLSSLNTNTNQAYVQTSG